MVKTWRKSESEIGKGSIMEAGLGSIEEIEGAVSSGWEKEPLSELRKQPASKFVKTQQRWCDKFIAESYGHANIEKEKAKKSFSLVLNAINVHSGGKPFDVNDVLSWMNIKDISEGTLQRRILCWMVCLGILELKHIKVIKKGKEKIKYVFVKSPIPEQCPNIKSGKCEFDWKRGAITDYFPPEYKKDYEKK